MNNGPYFNNIKISKTYRSSLGIEETINSMQAKLCQAISSNTPYAYYFAFIIWCFYDYKKNDSLLKDIDAYSYLKKQCFFFSLAFLMKNPSLVGVFGHDGIIKLDFEKDNYTYDDDYINSLTTLEYYISGLDQLDLLKSRKPDNTMLKYPTVSEYGESLAIAFENNIKDTTYYQKYRFDNSFPRSALIEMGNIISLDLRKNKELKIALKDVFFSNKYSDILELDKGLVSSKDLICFISKKFGPEFIYNNLRNVLYDYFSPRGNNIPYPNELNDIIKKWELVTARRYYTFSISIIFKYMLPLIEQPLSLNEWLTKCVSYYTFDFDINSKTSDVIESIDLSYEQREDIVNRCIKNGYKEQNAISDGFKLLLSVYKRLHNREDLNEEQMDIVVSDYDTLPLDDYLKLVDSYLDKSILDFMNEIMIKYCIQQNEITANRKLFYENKYGFHFEKTIDKYCFVREYNFGLGNDRFITLTGILKQLDMIEGDSNGR